MVFARFFRDISLGVKRSREWPRVRKQHLLEHPTCERCGGRKGLEIHHIKPFHLEPELELAPENLATLCERMKCHFIFGHLYDWKSYNSELEADLSLWKLKERNRP